MLPGEVEGKVGDNPNSGVTDLDVDLSAEINGSVLAVDPAHRGVAVPSRSSVLRSCTTLAAGVEPIIGSF
jgi:hypothetical protein